MPQINADETDQNMNVCARVLLRFLSYFLFIRVIGLNL
jgi:hypothetical protein